MRIGRWLRVPGQTEAIDPQAEAIGISVSWAATPAETVHRWNRVLQDSRERAVPLIAVVEPDQTAPGPEWIADWLRGWGSIGGAALVLPEFRDVGGPDRLEWAALREISEETGVDVGCCYSASAGADAARTEFERWDRLNGPTLGCWLKVESGMASSASLAAVIDVLGVWLRGVLGVRRTDVGDTVLDGTDPSVRAALRAIGFRGPWLVG